MEKYIIGFYASANSGKTGALKKLIELLEQKSEQPAEILKSNNDIVAIINYKNVKIGIATGGDYKKIVQDNLKLLVEHGCELIVTACRTSGGTNEAINAYKNDVVIHYLSCPYIHTDSHLTEDLLINSKANFIYTYLDSFISKQFS